MVAQYWRKQRSTEEMASATGMAGLFLLLLAVLLPEAVDASCCYQAKELMCRETCEQILSSKSESHQRHLLQKAPEFCPSSMTEFWNCMNSSLPGASKKSDGWVGLGCCELAIAAECRRTCKQASSTNDILKSCRKEYENALISCVNRNEMGSVCCSYAGRHTNCREYCQAIFRTDSSPGPSQIKAVENYCAAVSPPLLECVNNYTQSYPVRNASDSVHCCDRAEEKTCQAACKMILMSTKSEHDIVEDLIRECKKSPLPQDPLWQCFLESSRSVQNGVTVAHQPSTGLDGAKLHCCLKANSSLCRTDCVQILRKCGDHNKFPESDNAESICERLSSTDDTDDCIPLDTYLRSSPLDNITEDVTHPCNPNPCPAHHLCEVNRKECLPGEPCLPYFCTKGCKLGEASDFLVRQGELIQVPSGKVGCYKICTCKQSGTLESCMEMNCVDQTSCNVGGQHKNHGTFFKVACNSCSCVAGKVQCSKRQCLHELSSDSDRSIFTGLPCNCADKFVPVCGNNGRTYPSACIARCVGLLDHQFEFGECSSKDPCNPNPCHRNQRCVSKRQVCLTSFERFPCLQYECIPKQLKCEHMREPVCDIENTEHPNICTLYQRGKQLSYKGLCQTFCKSMDPVCGHNGETYTNVCSAYSDRVAVDYYGRCQDVGILTEHSFHSECASIKCPAKPKVACKAVIPPGACCPLCAGVLRILYDKEKLDRFAEATKKWPTSILDILHKIRLHISVPQCDVFGYLSVESEIIVLVMPVDNQMKKIQRLRACSSKRVIPVILSHLLWGPFYTSGYDSHLFYYGNLNKNQVLLYILDTSAGFFPFSWSSLAGPASPCTCPSSESPFDLGELIFPFFVLLLAMAFVLP
ncbi:reversion-inducing cysteine-rich protein with Kazal motifs isoform 5-T6 [Anomaloglossus baeobatrachus]|uniref:reversion-inducing cysteine-rich protein with Kazal motifs isoform X5 n=1 Tax=Anomaloglossus baeobatrachus TaxID=238106 RepID=UPI003F4F5D6A